MTAAEGASAATVEVADRGGGMPQEERERIFERFYRGRGRGSEGGFGLGLAIGSELAERMGGSLTLADRPGGGTRFVLSLPRRSGGGERTGSGPRPGPGQRRVLSSTVAVTGFGSAWSAIGGKIDVDLKASVVGAYWLNSSERSRTSFVHGARQRSSSKMIGVISTSRRPGASPSRIGWRSRCGEVARSRSRRRASR